MISALGHEGPVIYLEHKMLSEMWLDYMGIGGRQTVDFDVPSEGSSGPVPDTWKPLPLGEAKIIKKGEDLTMVSLGLGVHRCLEARGRLKKKGISAGVVDLRSVSPLDKETVLEAISKSGRMLVVDEDYRDFGLSGELAAVALESGLSTKYSRVCTEDTIPYSRELEDRALPSTGRIVESALQLTRD
jgi:pyruvate dehydrogenase E1 component beta subunit